jgi:hypothetical protein
MRVNVPSNLRGASLLAAHGWVKSNIRSNPGGDDAHYVLRNPHTNNTLTLTDLTNGHTKAVDIEFETGVAVRTNPAPGYYFSEKPPVSSHRPGNSQVWMMVPDDIRPSTIHRLIAEHGLNRGTILATKMLHAQMDDINIYSPVASRLIKARSLEDLSGFIRKNPRRPGAGYPLQVLGGKGAMFSSSVDRRIKEYLNEEGYSHKGYDSPMGEYVMSELDQLAVNHRLPLNYTANERTFKDFCTKVAQPYLVSAMANRNLLLYLNRTLIPHMRRLIAEGKFTRGTIPGLQKKKIAKGAMKDTLTSDLSAHYEFVVNRLATDPSAFYYGKADAMVAHPGFMFPQFGLMILPLPEKLTGNTPAELFLKQAGEEPHFGRDKHGKYVMQLDGLAMIAPLTGRVNMGKVFDLDWFRERIMDLSVGQVIAAVADEAFGKSTSWMSEPGVATDEIISVSKALNERFQRMGKTTDVGEAVAEKEGNPGAVAAIIVDLPGLKPTPLGWPEPLVIAMMETLFDVRQHVMNLREEDVHESLFTPSLTSKFQFDPLASVQTGIRKETDPRPYDTEPGKVVFAEAFGAVLGLDPKDWAEMTGHDKSKMKEVSTKNIKQLLGKKEDIVEEDKQAALKEFYELANEQGIGVISLAAEPGKMSIMEVLKRTIEHGRIKYNFTPTEDDIAFVLHLLLYTVKCIGSGEDGGIGRGLEDFFEGIAKSVGKETTRMRRAASEQFDGLMKGVKQDDSFSPLEKAAFLEAIAAELERTKGAVGSIIPTTFTAPSTPPKPHVVDTESLRDIAAEKGIVFKKEPDPPKSPPMRGEVDYLSPQEVERIEQEVRANPSMAKTFDSLASSMRGIGMSPDDLDSTIVSLRSQAQEEIASTPKDVLSTEKQKEMVDVFAATMSEMVGDAFKQVQAEATAKEAEAAALRDRIEMLDDFAEAEEDTLSSMFLSKQRKAIDGTISSILDRETAVVNIFAEVLPSDVTSTVKTQVSLFDRGNHIAFSFRDWKVKYDAFIESLSMTRDCLKNLLMGTQARAAAGEEESLAGYINILKSAIDTTMALETEYVKLKDDVEETADKFVTRLKAKQGHPPELYRIAIQLKRISAASLASRKELSKMMGGRASSRGFSAAHKALSKKVTSGRIKAACKDDSTFEAAIEWMVRNHGDLSDDNDWMAAKDDDESRLTIGTKALSQTKSKRTQYNFSGPAAVLQDAAMLRDALQLFTDEDELGEDGKAAAIVHGAATKEHAAILSLPDDDKTKKKKAIDLLFRVRGTLTKAMDADRERQEAEEAAKLRQVAAGEAVGAVYDEIESALTNPRGVRWL